MNRNGTPAIIVIYLMTTLTVFMDRQGQCLADAITAPKINLYSTFKDRLNATSNFAETQYDTKTKEVVNKIYDLAGQILHEQLKNQADEPQTGKLVDDADPPRSHDILPPAVAPAAINTPAELAKKNYQLMNAQVATPGQLEHRQARKARKASRRFCPRPHRMKKSYSGEKTAQRLSSRPKWENRRMRPSLSMSVDGNEEWELFPISTQWKRRQSATLSTAEWKDKANMDNDWRRQRNSGSKGSLHGSTADAVSSAEINGLTKSIGDGSNWHGLPSDKWRTKLQIDGTEKNLRNCRSWPNLSDEQSNELIESDESVGEADDERQRRSSDTNMDEHGPINTRSTDSFPEVFAGPLVDSNSLPIIGAGNGLNEAIKNANTLLTSVPNIVPNQPAPSQEDAGRRIGKQIQSLDVSPLEGSNLGVAQSHGLGDTANLTNVMEKVLGELESLKERRADDNTQPEGSPCDIVGRWNSETIGLQFHITLADTSSSSRAYAESKKMEIELTERVPPRRHDLLDCDWSFEASTLKQFGGPFYITAEKPEKYMVATFAGLCRTCGGIPTIFGAWTFVYPAKDCQDVSLAVENKRDVLRKDNMEAKRKHRRDKLTGNSGKCVKCSH